MNTRKLAIARIARNSIVGKTRLYFYIRFIQQKKQAEKAIAEFVGNRITEKEKQQLLSQMRDAMINYHWSFNEFFLYDYTNLSDAERKSYVMEYEKNLFCDKANDYSVQYIFDNKGETYKRFKKYYGRDLATIHSLHNTPQYNEFIEKHPVFIVKPIVSSLGIGIKKIDIRDGSTTIESMLKIYRDGFVMEELITQEKSIASLHPQSVNTLRMRSFKTKNEVIVFKPTFRIGRGDSIIDNAGAGGILAGIDIETGIITNAIDKKGNIYKRHPDTGVDIVGFKIPRWEEAMSLAKQLAEIIPENRYTGWDLALTDKGWVMIEGNTKSQLGFQLIEKKGFRKEFERLLKM